ncbi:2-amino-4-hydroxy-6-hydroxymethyldihydropteridine diphosphokinase [bacterium Unc6]|nr:2-amino-4-hydroxy-6-hydroxymethyldihydropteridine diphosphokinase [bacterium Unc6]
MEKYWNERVFIGVGSNVGKRELFIKKALDLIRNNRQMRLVKISSIIETEPVGSSKRKFLNAVIEIRTILSPVQLLKRLKYFEKILGRKNTGHWGAREIDLDILYFGKRKINTSSLRVPHPFIQERDFVQILLSEF